MNTLKELLALREAEAAPEVNGTGPVEISDIIEFYPSQHKKMIHAMAARGRLAYGGELVFTEDGEHGDALDSAIRAAEEFLKDQGFPIEVHFDVPYTSNRRVLSKMIDDDDSDDDEDMKELRNKLSKRQGRPQLELVGDEGFEFEAEVTSQQATWIGYDKSSHNLLIGFDIWLGDNEFNEEWDNKFEDAFEVEFDMDNPDHEAVYNSAWKTFQDLQFMGAIVAVDEDGQCEEYAPAIEGGFHRAMSRFLRRDNVIPLM